MPRYSLFIKDGVEHLQIRLNEIWVYLNVHILVILLLQWYLFQNRFYIKGIRNQATVHADMEKKNEKFEYNYLVAETEGYPKEKIFVVDNRKQTLSFQDF